MKFVNVDVSAKPVTVSGITTWANGETTYIVKLKKGQRLNITADSKKISIAVFVDFEPEGSTMGSYTLTAANTQEYGIIAESNPLRKYTLTFRLVK